MTLTIDGRSRRVVLVHWKNRLENAVEVFSNLKVFCSSYTDYNYNTLNNYLSKNKIPFENDDVRIERMSVIAQIVPQKPALFKGLFWDIKYDEINWTKNYRMVIERVIERGDAEEWAELTRFYGTKKVVQTLTSEIKFLPDYAIDKVCGYFNLSKEDLACYSRKQSRKGHWL